MMTPDILETLSIIVIGLWGLFKVVSREPHAKHSFVTFGDSNESTPEARAILFLEFARQQRWAFGLLWFSCAAGLILAITVLSRIIFASRLDTRMLVDAAALTIDLGVAVGAWKLYQVSSKRVENAAKNLSDRSKIGAPSTDRNTS
jgi:hypothetical protein